MDAEKQLENGMWLSNTVKTVSDFFGTQHNPIPQPGSDIGINPVAYLNGGLGSISAANGWLVASLIIGMLMIVGMCCCDWVKKIGIGIFIGLAIGVYIYLRLAI